MASVLLSCLPGAAVAQPGFLRTAGVPHLFRSPVRDDRPRRSRAGHAEACVRELFSRARGSGPDWSHIRAGRREAGSASVGGAELFLLGPPLRARSLRTWT